LTFAVGYALPLKETARDFGAFYDPKRGIIHATGFLGLVQFYKSQAR
jgi:hypothetical protein